MKRLSAYSKAVALLLPFIPGLQPALHARSMTSSASNPNLACEVNPTTVSETGYQLEVYVTNAGGSVINGWTVTLSFSEPALLTGSWNAHVSGLSASAVSGSNVAWNGKLLPGQTTSFGLQGNHDGSFLLPACAAK